MARVLYTSWFSTFARKAALALELKGLDYQAIDGLAKEQHAALARVNPRIEVPTLIDGDITVVNSSDIIQYLDWQYPERPLYPVAVKDRVTARALERLHDRRVDPIIVDCSYWHWAERTDARPEGMLAAGQRDLEGCFEVLESELATRSQPWPFGSPGLVECAWFANIAAARPLGFKLDEGRFPTVTGWLSAMREHPVFAADRRRTVEFLKTLSSSTHERVKLFWSGERIEWLLSRGYHAWFAQEIAAGRAVFPP